MTITTETELKLRLSEADLIRLARLPWLRALRQGRARSRRLRATYLDRADGCLWARGVTLRLRETDGGVVQTVKAAPSAAAGLIQRLEWESARPDATPDLDGPRAAGLGAALDGIDDPTVLQPWVTTDIRRTEVPLSDGSWTVLLALDRGTVAAEGRSAPVHEAELELVAGSPADLYALALRIAAALPVRLEGRAKAEQGCALRADAPPPAAVKGRAPDLTPDMTVEEAFRAIAGACLAQMSANVRPLDETRDGEAVHQMRVATRRLRSAMTTFRSVVAGPDMDAAKAELRWLMSHLGPARDSDVFLRDILDPVRACFPGDAGLEGLRQLFAAHRETRFDAAVGAVRDPRCARLLLRLGAWIEGGDWRTAPDRPERDQPLPGFARAMLEKRWRKVARPAKRFGRLSDEQRHQLRIQAKKLRYSVEFVGGLYKTRDVRGFTRALSGVQDQLGALNDVAVASETLHHTLAEQRADEDPAVAAERAWAAGLVAGWHRRDARDHLAEAGHTLETVRRAAGFWR